jgi:hypothetical protein
MLRIRPTGSEWIRGFEPDESVAWIKPRQADLDEANELINDVIDERATPPPGSVNPNAGWTPSNIPRARRDAESAQEEERNRRAQAARKDYLRRLEEWQALPLWKRLRTARPKE